MAKKNFTLPDTELVEVVAYNGSKTITKTMTFGEWLKLKKNPKFYYVAYQIGFRNINRKKKKMKRFWQKVKKAFAIHNVSTRNGYYATTQLTRKFDSLKFWTPELIEWIGKENDPVKLAVASCLVNCYEWPEWLPGKPKDYGNKEDRQDLFYTVEVYEMLKQKSEKIAPKLYSYIWLTHYYRSYVC